jgi:predicted CopG family antitoxin
MDPVKSLEEISERMEEEKSPGGKGDGYKAIRVRQEVYEELGQWRSMWSDISLSDTLSRVLTLARRELKNVAERERRVRERMDLQREK